MLDAHSDHCDTCSKSHARTICNVEPTDDIIRCTHVTALGSFNLHDGFHKMSRSCSQLTPGTCSERGISRNNREKPYSVLYLAPQTAATKRSDSHASSRIWIRPERPKKAVNPVMDPPPGQLFGQDAAPDGLRTLVAPARKPSRATWLGLP